MFEYERANVDNRVIFQPVFDFKIRSLRYDFFRHHVVVDCQCDRMMELLSCRLMQMCSASSRDNVFDPVAKCPVVPVKVPCDKIVDIQFFAYLHEFIFILCVSFLDVRRYPRRDVREHKPVVVFFECRLLEGSQVCQGFGVGETAVQMADENEKVVPVFKGEIAGSVLRFETFQRVACGVDVVIAGGEEDRTVKVVLRRFHPEEGVLFGRTAVDPVPEDDHEGRVNLPDAFGQAFERAFAARVPDDHESEGAAFLRSRQGVAYPGEIAEVRRHVRVQGAVCQQAGIHLRADEEYADGCPYPGEAAFEMVVHAILRRPAGRSLSGASRPGCAAGR